MKIGVISDTHGNAGAVRRAQSVLSDAAAWIHLGDYAADASNLSPLLPQGTPVFTVRGNCDGLIGGPCTAELEQVITFENVRVLALHGHRYYVERDSNALLYRAQELNCQVVLYGHTHISHIEAAGSILIVNPGSPSLPRWDRKPSIAVLEIDKSDYTAHIELI